MTAGLTAAYAGAFLLFALPILTLGNGGNVGTLVMQGATEPFRAFLALRPAPYAEVTPSNNAQSGGEPGISVGGALICWHVIGRKSLTSHESV